MIVVVVAFILTISNFRVTDGRNQKVTIFNDMPDVTLHAYSRQDQGTNVFCQTLNCVKWANFDQHITISPLPAVPNGSNYNGILIGPDRAQLFIGICPNDSGEKDNGFLVLTFNNPSK